MLVHAGSRGKGGTSAQPQALKPRSNTCQRRGRRERGAAYVFICTRARARGRARILRHYRLRYRLATVLVLGIVICRGPDARPPARKPDPCPDHSRNYIQSKNGFLRCASYCLGVLMLRSCVLNTVSVTYVHRTASAITCQDMFKEWEPRPGRTGAVRYPRAGASHAAARWPIRMCTHSLPYYPARAFV